jgi:hypothetical protein
MMKPIRDHHYRQQQSFNASDVRMVLESENQALDALINRHLESNNEHA